MSPNISNPKDVVLQRKCRGCSFTTETYEAACKLCNADLGGVEWFIYRFGKANSKPQVRRFEDVPDHNIRGWRAKANDSSVPRPSQDPFKTNLPRAFEARPQWRDERRNEARPSDIPHCPNNEQPRQAHRMARETADDFARPDRTPRFPHAAHPSDRRQERLRSDLPRRFGGGGKAFDPHFGSPKSKPPLFDPPFPHFSDRFRANLYGNLFTPGPPPAASSFPGEDQKKDHASARDRDRGPPFFRTEQDRNRDFSETKFPKRERYQDRKPWPPREERGERFRPESHSSRDGHPQPDPFKHRPFDHQDHRHQRTSNEQRKRWQPRESPWKRFYEQKRREENAKKSSDTHNDLYGVLDVTRTATQEEITKAYRQLSLKHHPDRCAGDTEDKKKAGSIMAQINAAYDVLGDAAMRKAYDRTGKIPRNKV